jgi:hypothetical protein
MSSQDGNHSLNNDNNTADSEAVPITRFPPTRRLSFHRPDPIDIEIANAELSPTNPVAARPSATQLSANDSPLNPPDTTSSPLFEPPHPPTALVPSPLVAPTPEPYTPAEKRERELIFTVLPHAPQGASTHDLRWAHRAPLHAREGPPEGPWVTWYCHRCGLRKDFPVKWLNSWRWKLRCDDPIQGCNYGIFYKKRNEKNVLMLSTD